MRAFAKAKSCRRIQRCSYAAATHTVYAIKGLFKLSGTFICSMVLLVNSEA